jgi:hypothetical protein
MTSWTAFALTAALLAAGPALAAGPITAKDGAGTVYRLNQDGTYAIVATGEDGKTYLLAPTGRWAAQGAGPSLEETFIAFIDKAMADPKLPKPSEADWPKYRSCLIALFNTLPEPAQRILVTGDGPEDGYKKMSAEYPDAGRQLNDGDKVCRENMAFTTR